MKIVKTRDYKEMSRRAAELMAAQVLLKPNSVLGLATGSSPIGLYEKLVQWYENGDLDFSLVRTVNLDEYEGLSKENPQSYYYFMKENFFSHVNVREENIHLPDGTALDGEEECLRYDKLIRSMGGVDLQLLGLGHDGHIGFNEPGGSFSKKVHVTDLAEPTIQAQ